MCEYSTVGEYAPPPPPTDNLAKFHEMKYEGHATAGRPVLYFSVLYR
jgi:hypothetical protein